MAQEPIATKGNFLHIYDFRVKAGHEAEFIKSFEAFDYSDGNPMHKSSARVRRRLPLSSRCARLDSMARST